MLAGRQVLDHSDPALITKRLAADRIMRLLRLTARIRMLFTIARKTWSLRFVCAAMTVAPPMARRCQLTHRNAADCTATLKSRLTEQFIFPTITVAARARWLFQKITV